MTDQKSVLLKVGVDQSLAAQGVKSLRDLDASVQAIQKDLLKIDSQAADSAAVFKRLEDAVKLTERGAALEDLAKQFFNLGKVTDDFEGSLIDLRATLKDIGASGAEISKVTAAFKEMQAAESKAGSAAKGIGSVEGVRRTGSAINQLVGPNIVGEGLQKAGDLLQVSKELEAVGSALGIVGTTSSAVGVEATTAAGGLAAIDAALSPMLLVLAPIALALIDFKLAMDLVNAATEKGTEQEKAKFSEEQRQDDLRKQNRDAGRTRSPEQNKQIIDDSLQDTAALEDRIKEKRKQIAQTDADYAALGSSLNIGERARLKALGEQQKKDLDELAKQFNDQFAVGQNAAVNVQPTIDTREAETKATNDLLNASKDLVDQREKDYGLTQLTSESAKGHAEQLKVEAAALKDARAKLAQSGNTSKEVTAQIAEYDKALKDNAHSQEYLTKTAIPLIKAREDEQKAIEDQKKALQEAQKDWESFQNSLKKLGDVNKEISKLESDRKAQVQREQEDDVRQATRSATEKDFANRIAVAKREEAEQAVRDKAAAENVASETKRTEGISKIDANFFDSELKAYDKFIETEKKATDRANLDRLRTLEDAQTDLRDLASKGDVAGFVSRSNQAKTQLKRQTEDADLAARQRQADYEKEINTARDARQKQIDDLNASLEQERQAREAAATQRIAEIEAQGQEANSKSAQLEQELNDIREQWRKDDLQRQRDLEEQSYEERLQVQKDKQAEILAEATNFFNEWISSLSKAASPLLDLVNVGINLLGGALPRHQGGLDYVPHDNYLARLDEGEKILTQREANEYRTGRNRGGGGPVYNVAINNTVGDVATKSMLDEYQDHTVNGVKEALKKARGQG